MVKCFDKCQTDQRMAQLFVVEYIKAFIILWHNVCLQKQSVSQICSRTAALLVLVGIRESYDIGITVWYPL